jgi:hypothetical protein
MSLSLKNATDRLPLSLAAGDLVDRAVRFYRKFFWTFVLIAAPPILVGTVISVLWTVLGRQVFYVSADSLSFENTVYFLFLWLGTIVIWLVETIATLVIMGGASRNFIRHLLFGEAITFRETYTNAGKRFFSLLSAAVLITFLVGTIGVVVFYFGVFLAAVVVLGIAYIFSSLPSLVVALSIIAGVAVAISAIWLFFLAASRLAYVPQVIMVEGLGVFSAIGRSATLARGNMRSLVVLFAFTTVATYSALAILYVPLAWYASANGVELLPFVAGITPAWYEVASNLIWQISLIVLSPVWMVGLCLLYVNSRVRNEGYDIELMAAARLGDIPEVPTTYLNPLQPALSSQIAVPRFEAAAAAPKRRSTLGLLDDQ